MDDTDRALIALLRKDARASIATLAAKLKVSRGTVSNRLRKLEDAQIIVGYSVRLRPDAEPEHIRAWIGVRVYRRSQALEREAGTDRGDASC